MDCDYPQILTLNYRYKWTVVKTRKLVYNPPTTKAIRNPSSPRTEVHTNGQGFLK
jgi:ubiquinol-cytochrome c reductase cytochrome c1 subunit